jgi:hypothetical protein
MLCIGFRLPAQKAAIPLTVGRFAANFPAPQGKVGDKTSRARFD